MISSLYYNTMIKKAKSEVNTSLIWKNFSCYNFDICELTKSFTTVIEVPNIAETENIIIKQIKKFFYVGSAFQYTKLGKKTQIKDNKILLCIFSDEELLTNRILKNYRGYDKVKVILLDEGLHLYDRLKEKKRSLMQRLNDGILGITYAPYIGATPEIETIIAKFPQALPSYVQKGRTLICQSNVCRYSESWEKLIKSSSLLKQLKKGSPPLLFYLGQPLTAENLSEGEELDKLTMIFNIIKKSYTILVKPHPRDRVGKYNCLIGENIYILSDLEIAWIPAEIIADYMEPNFIMSAWSSSCSSLGISLVYIFPLLGLTLSNSVLDKGNISNSVYIKTVEQLANLHNMERRRRYNSSRVNQPDIEYFINQIET